MQLQTSRSPLLPSRKISQSGPHASSAACSPQSRRWTRSSSLLQPSAASRCTSPGSLLQCCQSRPIRANPVSRSLASSFSSALQESWDTPQLQDRHRGLLQLRNLLDYCPFPPPGIAAFSLPDTISAPPQSQRLTPLRTASTPLPFRNCHSEGIRQGCPKNLNCKCSVDLRTSPRCFAAKNNSLAPHTTYNKVMSTRKHRLLSRVGSLLVVLCLLAAPLCATRCALSSCANPSTNEQSATGCHHPSKHSHGSSVLAGAVAPTCLPTDSLLTTLPAQQFRLLSAGLDHVTPLLAMAQDSSFSLGGLALTTPQAPNRNSSPGNSVLSFSNPPLRL